MKKSSETTQVIAGGVAVAVLAFLLIFFNSEQDERAAEDLTEYQVAAAFHRIDGLQVGADVRVAGIGIGKVSSVALDDKYRAIVTFRLSEDVALPADTSAAIHTDGLFGSKFVVLDPGGDEVNLKDGDRITFTQDAVVVSDLLDLIIAEGRAQRNLPGEEKR